MAAKDERRRAKRYEVNLHAEIVVDVFHVQGTTQDLNNEGALIMVESKVPPQDIVGEAGTLFLEDGATVLEIPCEIRHITDIFIGLRIIQNDLKTGVKLRELIQKHSR